ncbi:MAG: hypothetical protein AB1649_15535 [Chloroflexota bacterium]
MKISGSFLALCLISLLLAGCGTLEIGIEITPISTTELPPTSGATSIPSQSAPTDASPIPQPGTADCANRWFFTFDEEHPSLDDFCPEAVKVLEAVGQDFEGGRVYRYDPDPDYPADQRGTVYIIYNDGEWVTYPDTWRAGDPSSDPSLVPPEGRFQPVDNIGKVWRENPEVRERLGWAYEPQSAFQGRVQRYLEQQGVPSGDSHFTFIDHGKWSIVLLLNSVDMGPNTWEVAGNYK